MNKSQSNNRSLCWNNKELTRSFTLAAATAEEEEEDDEDILSMMSPDDQYDIYSARVIECSKRIKASKASSTILNQHKLRMLIAKRTELESLIARVKELLGMIRMFAVWLLFGCCSVVVREPKPKS